MDLLKFKNKKLYLNNFKIENILKKRHTPFYLYSLDQIKKNIDQIKSSFKNFDPLVCYAIKANSNLSILKELKKENLGADVVSIGELKLALKAGINPNKIVFSGVGKTDSEIKFAIKKGILSINAESKNEIQLINNISKKLKKNTNIGIRINPNIKARTNKKITTGSKINKFGVSISEFFKIIENKSNFTNINIFLLSVHIGSQIKDIKVYKKVLRLISKSLIKLKSMKHFIEYVDLGGGMGIPYFKKDKKFDFKKFGLEIKKFHKKEKIKIIFEIGRFITGNSGFIISKIIYIKKIKDRYFVILDTGMNDMARSAIYEAFHEIIPLKKNTKKLSKKVEFVGPICESSDTFGVYKNYSFLKDGDYVCITNCGAYGRTLSSNYNMRPLIEEIILTKNKYKTVRSRQNINDLI
tara:strand:- start:20189 stop:21421 length:1233 start_codon:yes stop_codon:yes gene_type:complete